jgi:hypothetical protein
LLFQPIIKDIINQSNQPAKAFQKNNHILIKKMTTRSMTTRSMTTRSMTAKVVVAIEETPVVEAKKVKKVYVKRVLSSYELHKADVEANEVIRIKNRAKRVQELVDKGYLTPIPDERPTYVDHKSSLVSQIKIVHTDELTKLGLTVTSHYPHDFPDAEELGFYCGHNIVIDVFVLPYSCIAVSPSKVEYMDRTKEEVVFGYIRGKRIKQLAVAPKGYYWQYFKGSYSRFNDNSSYELFPLPIHYKPIKN